LHTTPESLHEHLPFERDGLVITADARIDNREELIDSLQLKTHQPERISDSELILHAYQQWGEDCPAKLVGDFAFVIWDTTRRMMFCARDHIGLKPFYYYHRPNHLLAFASEIKGLLSLRGIPCELNETRIADFLTVNFENRRSTFFKNIYRLPAAHWLTATTESHLRIEQYWKLEPDDELRFPCDQEYEEAFLECFSDVIAARLRGERPVGALLSGGLDSSSIVCLSRQLLARRGTRRLHTFSAVFPGLPDEERAVADERPFIDAVLAEGSLDAHFINTCERSPLGNIGELLPIMDEPYIAPNFYLHWGIYQAARQADIRILLDGFGGDSVISHGSMYLTELARTGQWHTFSKEVRASASLRQTSLWPYLKIHALDYLTELALAGCWHAFLRNARALRSHFPIPARSLIINFGIRPAIRQILGARWGRIISPSTLQPANDSILLNADFARRIGYNTPCSTSINTRAYTQRADQCAELNSAVIPVALEEANKAAAVLGIETAFPYFDRRLMELCLAIPGNQKLRDGWGRSYMRRALKNILPDKIRWRNSKGDLSPNFRRGFLHDDWKLIEETMRKLPVILGDFINIPTIQAATARYRKTPNSDDEMVIWKVVILSLWMAHFAKLNRLSWVVANQVKEVVIYRAMR
jgi:asparagine synthase (glutamine-hydrolysing)